jgi:hypothetical protein
MTSKDAIAGTPARPRFGIAHVIAYGQSLATGWEGWPALSTVPRHDCLMLGHSVRAVSDWSAHWQPVGDCGLHPLKATVQSVASGAVLTAEQIAALPPTNPALGETVLEAAVNTWRGRMKPEDTRRLLASACGTGGRTLEQLSKGAEPELFNRLRDCARTAKQAAAAIGADYSVAALLFLQGESNNWALNGGTADRAAYKALLGQFYRDFVADIAVGIAGQQGLPVMFTYQTGGAYASDTQSVPQAQLELALEMPEWFLVAPVYPLLDKPSGHLDANAYRWLGSQFGKVMHRVLTLGEDFKPLHPLRAAMHGGTVLVEFHVPVPPLAWGRPYAGHTALDIPERGFTVLDACGPVPITAVELDGPTSVRITLERPPDASAELLYADRRHFGRGSLHDSDREIAEDCYEFDAASGHYPSADIAELVGRPYPLMNWCVGFATQITPDAQRSEAAR